MDENNKIGSWNEWARYIVELLEIHSKEIEKILNTCVDKRHCEQAHAEIAQLNKEFAVTIANIKSIINTGTSDVLVLKEQLKAHTDSHINRWKWVGILGGILGIIATTLLLLEKYVFRIKP